MIRLYAIHCGWFIGPAATFIEGGEGSVRMPVPAYLIDHPKGKVLFDTGMNLRFQQELNSSIAPGGGYSIEMDTSHEIGARLRQMGIDPDAIDFVLLSHLHMDHCAGLAQIPNATMVVQQAEYDAGINEEGNYDRSYFDLGHKVLRVKGEHDLFGDGTIVLFPTPGHSPGHQSARIRLPGGDVVLAADCCYFKRSLDQLRPPMHNFDREAQLASLRRLAEMQRGGARILFGHDPEQWQRICGGETAPAQQEISHREIIAATAF
jgi:glyoxylase-like metal-dependent hydrolase (beta-lactamase superfamily II)